MSTLCQPATTCPCWPCARGCTQYLCPQRNPCPMPSPLHWSGPFAPTTDAPALSLQFKGRYGSFPSGTNPNCTVLRVPSAFIFSPKVSYMPCSCLCPLRLRLLNLPLKVTSCGPFSYHTGSKWLWFLFPFFFFSLPKCIFIIFRIWKVPQISKQTIISFLDLSCNQGSKFLPSLWHVPTNGICLTQWEMKNYFFQKPFPTHECYWQCYSPTCHSRSESTHYLNAAIQLCPLISCKNQAVAWYDNTN